MRVLQHNKEDRMDDQRYDILNQQTGHFETKTWQPVNTPVLNKAGKVEYIVHSVEDITEQVRSRQREEKLKGIEQAYGLFMQAPISIHKVKGNDLIIEMANEPTLEYWGRGTEVVGKPLMEALPELEGQGYDKLLREVLQTGRAKEVYDAPVTLERNGKKELGFFNFIYKPYYEDGNTAAIGVVCVSSEVTDKVRSKNELKESEIKYRRLFESMDQGFCIIEMIVDADNKAIDYRFLEVNPVFEKHNGLKDAVGKTMRELVPNTKPHWFEQYGNVALTGKAIRFVEESQVMGRWFDVYAFPIRDAEQRRVAVLFTDITEQKKLDEAIRQSESNLLNMILQSPVAMAILRGPSFVVEIANDRMYELWGRGKDDLLNKSIFEGLPEVRYQGYEDLLNGVYKTGDTFSAQEIPITLPREGEIKTVYINLLYEAFREGDGTISGIMAVATDVTEQVVTRMRVEESNQEFKFVTDFMPQIIWSTKPDGYHEFYNKQWYDYTGLTFEQSKDTGWNTVLHADDQERAWEVWRHSLKTGEPYEIEYRFRRYDGAYRWFLGRALPLRDESGTIIKWYGTCTDIHDQKRASDLLEQKVQERTVELKNQKSLLDNILRNSSNGISVSAMIRDPQGVVYDASTILANDSAIKYVGLPKDILFSKTAVELDPAIFSSPYGQACLKTLETGEPSLIQYYLDMSKRWLELTLSRMDDDHLIHIFTDITSVKESQLQLETTIRELKRSNSNLEDFAYAASHDLKEPIRKIKVFCDRLKNNLQGRWRDEDQHYFEKVKRATERMQSLIDDLLTYSHVSTEISYLDDVDLNRKVAKVLEDLEVEVAEKKATIIVGSLPVIKGHKRQIQQLFQNLITNALKFSKPGTTPEIRISSLVMGGENMHSFHLAKELNNKSYNLLRVSDNGIGFQQEYADKIFKMFQRLHGRGEYEGTGIGLAIVRKVVENHKGFIFAESTPGEGATFNVLLPIE